MPFETWSSRDFHSIISSCMREQRQAKKRFKIDPESDEENHCDFNDEEEFSLRPHLMLLLLP